MFLTLTPGVEMPQDAPLNQEAAMLTRRTNPDNRRLLAAVIQVIAAAIEWWTHQGW